MAFGNGLPGSSRFSLRVASTGSDLLICGRPLMSGRWADSSVRRAFKAQFT